MIPHSKPEHAGLFGCLLSRYQPESKHSRWLQARFGGGSKRQRRIGIVALVRRLLADLWRFVEYGLMPEGTRWTVA